jgi:hypothetical protein
MGRFSVELVVAASADQAIARNSILSSPAVRSGCGLKQITRPW